LRNKVVDVFVKKMGRDAPELPYDVVSYLEAQLRNSALRDMVLHVVMQCGEVDKVAEWRVNLAKGFRVKGNIGSAKGGVVPFGRASDV
jgi:hypothetical protein